jgi:hypothetical protein
MLLDFQLLQEVLSERDQSSCTTIPTSSISSVCHQRMTSCSVEWTEMTSLAIAKAYSTPHSCKPSKILTQTYFGPSLVSQSSWSGQQLNPKLSSILWEKIIVTQIWVNSESRTLIDWSPLLFNFYLQTINLKHLILTTKMFIKFISSRQPLTRGFF